MLGASLREEGYWDCLQNLYFALSHNKSSVCLLTPEDLNPRRPQNLHRHRAVSNIHQQYTHQWSPAAEIARNLQPSNPYEVRLYIFPSQYKSRLLPRLPPPPPLSLKFSGGGGDTGPRRHSSHQPLWTQKAKLTAYSIG
jgi:hypothetical protein